MTNPDFEEFIRELDRKEMDFIYDDTFIVPTDEEQDVAERILDIID